LREENSEVLFNCRQQSCEDEQTSSRDFLALLEDRYAQVDYLLAESLVKFFFAQAD